MNDTTKKALEAATLGARQEVAVIQQSRELDVPQDIDWRKWPLPILVKILRGIPIKTREGDYYLSNEQALILGVSAYRLDLDPFLGEIYIVPGAHRVNIPLAGKMARAKKEGWKLGAPKFARIPEDTSKPALGYKCVLGVGVGDQTVEYTAMRAEWEMPNNPYWRTHLEHMLQVRAFEKAISFATGVGISEQPQDQDIEGQQIKEIDVTPAEFKPIQGG